MDDQLVFFTSQDDTDDSERRALAQTLRLGLVRYAAQTPLGRQLEVTQQASGPLGARQPANARPEDDPWSFWVWVFRTRFRMFVDAEEREETKAFSGSFSANRTTDEWKIRLGLSGNYREETYREFELNDSTFTNVSRSNALDARSSRARCR